MTEIARVTLPCSVSALEQIVLTASHNGHWHDATIVLDGNDVTVKVPKENQYDHAAQQ